MAVRREVSHAINYMMESRSFDVEEKCDQEDEFASIRCHA
jgi:hypothetical protein